MLNPQLVGDHRDELRIRRLRLRNVDRVPEQMRYRVDVAARPGDFDRVANGAFDAGKWKGIIWNTIFKFFRYLLVFR